MNIGILFQDEQFQICWRFVPLSFDLNAPLTTEYDSEEDEENENNIVDNTSKLDYNYLMD